MCNGYFCFHMVPTVSVGTHVETLLRFVTQERLSLCSPRRSVGMINAGMAWNICRPVLRESRINQRFPNEDNA